MRNLLLASLALAALLPNAGCLFGCGAYEGGGNQAYEREGEMLLICENGGFVATLQTSMIEGRFASTGTMTGVGTRGEDGAIAFEMNANEDGTAHTSLLGDAPWTAANLDVVAMDHANVLCTDLVQRTWWTATP